MWSSFQVRLPGSLTRVAPIDWFGCQTQSAAPVGSSRRAILPASITLKGSSITVPPSSFARAAASSALATVT